MKILPLPDTHGSHHKLRDLPEADVIVHSGDFTMNGSQQEAINFMNWFCDLPYKIRFSSVVIMMIVFMVQISTAWIQNNRKHYFLKWRNNECWICQFKPT